MKIARFDIDTQKGFTPPCPHELPASGGDEVRAAGLQRHASLEMLEASQEPRP